MPLIGQPALRRPQLRATVALAALAAALVTAPHWLAGIGHWLAVEGEPQPAAVIAVHGGNDARTRYGAALYHQGLAPALWHTGYPSAQQRIDATVLRAGVPAEAYSYLYSTSTWTDAEAIAREARAQEVASVLVITDWWHSRRTLCADRRHFAGSGIALSFASSPSPAGPDDWWRHPATRRPVLMELVKLAFYGVRYGMLPWGC